MIFSNFQNCACSEEDLKENKRNTPHLGWKYARLFVFGHYLFLGAHSFPRATLLGTVRLTERITNIRAYFREKMEAIVDTIANQNVCYIGYKRDTL